MIQCVTSSENRYKARSRLKNSCILIYNSWRYSRKKMSFQWFIRFILKMKVKTNPEYFEIRILFFKTLIELIFFNFLFFRNISVHFSIQYVIYCILC